jgi:hypothetical protein
MKTTERKGVSKMAELLKFENEKELEQEAITRHPHSTGIARWGGGARQKYRICNICDTEIQGTSFCGSYPRTMKSQKAETEHIKAHLKGD